MSCCNKQIPAVSSGGSNSGSGGNGGNGGGMDSGERQTMCGKCLMFWIALAAFGGGLLANMATKRRG